MATDGSTTNAHTRIGMALAECIQRHGPIPPSRPVNLTGRPCERPVAPSNLESSHGIVLSDLLRADVSIVVYNGDRR
jgi:hypothetical protein